MSFHIHPTASDKWDFGPVLEKITNPCKHHRVHPTPGFFIGGEKALNGAFVFELKVHCPVDGCEFYLVEYNPQEWNEHNPVPDRGDIHDIVNYDE